MKRDDGKVTFELDRDEQYFAGPSQVVARVLRNGEPVGAMRLSSELEFKWLKSRIDGLLDTDREEVDHGEVSNE